jgi:formamidopyrimidine-DNA glycosylase
MPELPEVETIRLGLQQYLVGHTIENIVVHLSKQFYGDAQLLFGLRIIAVRRFGKGLIIDFLDGYSLAVHVKMTGQLLYLSRDNAAADSSVGPVGSHPRSKSSASFAGAHLGTSTSVTHFGLPDKYTHVVFQLDNGAVLYYRDIRQFGWLRVVKTEEALRLPFFTSLGREPLRDLTLADFKKLMRVKAPIKTLLLDQHKIAGIGNIYANDALFLAGILPTRPALSLTPVEQERLFAAIEKVLTESISVGGASASNYVNVLGEKGSYQDRFLVYKRDGESCLNCKTIITRTKMGGRGTFVCIKCQQ